VIVWTKKFFNAYSKEMDENNGVVLCAIKYNNTNNAYDFACICFILLQHLFYLI